MNSIEKLIQIFSHFPGIGPRQAKRFVYFLLSRNNGAIDKLVENLNSLKNEVSICADCFRFFEKRNSNNPLCDICSDRNRDTNFLMIVHRDTDLESVEKSGVWNGIYFILGGSVPILDKEPEKKVRSKELVDFVKRKIGQKNLSEIVLAMNANPEGENTEDYVRNLLKPLLPPEIKISILGRGFSTGLELEYADRDTLKYALQNRS